MSIEWNDILHLPGSALAGDKRVPKTQIVKQGNLTRAQESILDVVTPVRFYASLQRSNSYMQPVRNDDYDIQSVIFLSCRLNHSKGASSAVRILHDAFPNPTVIMLEGWSEGSMAISSCIRRKSLAEHGAFVTEQVFSSGVFDSRRDEYEFYLERLSFETLPQTTLLDYLRAFGERTLLASTVRTLGYYPKCRESETDRLMGLVKELRSLDSHIKSLDEQRKEKGATLGETTKIRVEMKKRKEAQSKVAQEIKELCNG